MAFSRRPVTAETGKALARTAAQGPPRPAALAAAPFPNCVAIREKGGRRESASGGCHPPLRIMSKKSTLVLVAFMFLIISSIDSISSMLYMNWRRMRVF